MDREKRIVTSYRNPDTDGVVCAIVLADLLSADSMEWVPILMGRLSEESRYVLEYSGVAIPEFVERLPACKELALVDTHHRAQLPADLPFEKVRWIVDHHPGGDPALFSKARIQNEAVGAAATLMAEHCLERGAVEPSTAALLCLAILSNTSNFTAPSTTERDRRMYERLRVSTKLSEGVVAELFAQRARVLERGTEAALRSDLKWIDTPHGRVGIAQLELYDLESELSWSTVSELLGRIAREEGVDYCLFNGVDLRTRRSVVCCEGERTRRLLELALSVPFTEDPVVFERILLRKTDLVPALQAPV